MLEFKGPSHRGTEAGVAQSVFVLGCFMFCPTALIRAEEMVEVGGSEKVVETRLQKDSSRS